MKCDQGLHCISIGTLFTPVIIKHGSFDRWFVASLKGLTVKTYPGTKNIFLTCNLQQMVYFIK